jgi:predicted GTPase
VEDGPTLTHGGMSIGAGTVAANKYGAAEIIDARRYAVGSIAETFAAFPHLGGEVPAMGYSAEQLRDLEATLRNISADAVVDATPVNLSRLLKLYVPIVDVRYEFEDSEQQLAGVLERFEDRYLKVAPALLAGRAGTRIIAD